MSFFFSPNASCPPFATATQEVNGNTAPNFPDIEPPPALSKPRPTPPDLIDNQNGKIQDRVQTTEEIQQTKGISFDSILLKDGPGFFFFFFFFF